MGPLYLMVKRRRQRAVCGINSPPGLAQSARWPRSVTSPRATAKPATAQSFWGRSVPLENTSDLTGTSTQDVSGDAEGQRQLGRAVARTKKDLRRGGSRALRPASRKPATALHLRGEPLSKLGKTADCTGQALVAWRRNSFLLPQGCKIHPLPRIFHMSLTDRVSTPDADQPRWPKRQHRACQNTRCVGSSVSEFFF